MDPCGVSDSNPSKGGIVDPITRSKIRIPVEEPRAPSGCKTASVCEVFPQSAFFAGSQGI